LRRTAKTLHDENMETEETSTVVSGRCVADQSRRK
jgi:hypothetical protein